MLTPLKMRRSGMPPPRTRTLSNPDVTWCCSGGMTGVFRPAWAVLAPVLRPVLEEAAVELVVLAPLPLLLPLSVKWIAGPPSIVFCLRACRRRSITPGGYKVSQLSILRREELHTSETHRQSVVQVCLPWPNGAPAHGRLWSWRGCPGERAERQLRAYRSAREAKLTMYRSVSSTIWLHRGKSFSSGGMRFARIGTHLFTDHLLDDVFETDDAERAARLARSLAGHVMIVSLHPSSQASVPL